MKTSILFIALLSGSVLSMAPVNGAAEDLVLQACIEFCVNESGLPKTICKFTCRKIVDKGIEEADEFCKKECGKLFDDATDCDKDCDEIFSVGSALSQRIKETITEVPAKVEGAAENVIVEACVALCKAEVSALPVFVCQFACKKIVDAGLEEADSLCHTECNNLSHNPEACMKECDVIFGGNSIKSNEQLKTSSVPKVGDIIADCENLCHTLDLPYDDIICKAFCDIARRTAGDNVNASCHEFCEKTTFIQDECDSVCDKLF